MIFFYLMVGFGFIIKLIQFKYISKTFLIQIKYNFKMWTEKQLRMMIDERKNNNEYYHTLHEGRKMIWWGQVSSKINLHFGTVYTAVQVKEKFQGIVRDVRVNIKIHIASLSH